MKKYTEDFIEQLNKKRLSMLNDMLNSYQCGELDPEELRDRLNKIGEYDLSIQRFFDLYYDFEKNSFMENL